MQEVLDSVLPVLVEILVVLIGTVGLMAVNKLRQYLDGLKKKDESGMVDFVTDRVVAYAQAELSGSTGGQKRRYAVTKAAEILASKGINVNEEEIIAGIEDGVIKLKNNVASREIETGFVQFDGVTLSNTDEEKF